LPFLVSLVAENTHLRPDASQYFLANHLSDLFVFIKHIAVTLRAKAVCADYPALSGLR